ncbi:MAG: hypothetical protein ACLQLG_01235 [Thermoguttaceae bacterium]
MGHRYPILCCVLFAASGCAHVQLRNSSASDAQSAGDMITQQVVDNLARFACDPNSMPYFSYPNQGSTIITDQGTAGVTPGWSRTALGSFLFNTLGLSVSAQRSAQESFTVTPVTDPRKLELMRCAYQQAVQSCGYGAVSKICPDCQARFASFYTGDPNGDIRASADGKVTSECLKSDCCWFHVGCEKCAPKRCNCVAVGQYCGVYVWVGPEGRDQLTKLTLAILDYAMHDPPTKLSKTVIYYLDEYGLPTNQKQAVGQVTASIGIDERNESLLKVPRGDEARLEQYLNYRLKAIMDREAAARDSAERKTLIEEEQLVRSKMDFLHEQLRIGGLKEQYYNRTSAPGPSAIPLLDLYQRSLSAPATLPVAP